MNENSTLLATFGDAMLDGGFTVVPNTILFYKNRFKLRLRELYLIIMVMALHGRNKEVIRDKELDVSAKSFIRQRRSLEEKGYLKCEVVHSSRNNKAATVGIRYDFSGLSKKIEEFVKCDKELMSFLACYNILHEQTLSIRINYSKQNKYASYLIKIYKSIKKNKKDYKAVIYTAR